MGLDDLIVPLLYTGAAAAAAAAVAGFLYLRCSVRVPPSRAAVLYGGGRPKTPDPLSPETGSIRVGHPRIVVGGRAFVAPWGRDAAYLSLQPAAVDVSVRSMDGPVGAGGWEARVHVQVKIPSDPRFLARAAENLLGRSDEEVRALVRQTVEAAVPAVLARLSDPAPDWERTGAAVEASVGPDLAAYGLIVATLSIVELRRWSPESAVVRSLGSSGTSSRSADSTRVRSGSSSSLDDRLSRVEESLGVIGAEVVRLARDSSGWETTELGSVFDVPLGAEIPATPARPALGGGFVHDSEGATRRVRAPVLSNDEGPEATDGDRFLDAPKTER